MNSLNKYLETQRGKKLIVIFPHPDDESFGTGGLLVLAQKYGWKTTVVTLTLGEAGQCYINKQGLDLTKIRLREFRKATNILRVNKTIIGSFNDSKIKNSEKKLKRWIKYLFLTENPDAVVTYDHSGLTGHPDHISLSKVMLDLLKSQQESIDLFWVSAPKYIAKYLVNSKTLRYFSLPNYKLRLGINWIRKIKALKAHESQSLINFKLLFYLTFFRNEWYYKVDLRKKYKHKFVYFRI